MNFKYNVKCEIAVWVLVMDCANGDEIDMCDGLR